MPFSYKCASVAICFLSVYFLASIIIKDSTLRQNISFSTMSVEPLVYMPVERWNELKAMFKLDWPVNISAFTILETEEHLLKLGLDYGFKVYCPFGKVENGMVALNIKHTHYEVVIQCPENNTKALEEALRITKIIDWKQTIDVPYAPKHVMDCVKRLIAERNYIIDQAPTSDTFLLDKKSPLFNVRLPEELSFRLLPLKYSHPVNDAWNHKFPGSEWHFEFLIKANLGYGLFNGDELLSWVFIKEMGAVGHLYTLEQYRRKGYGELVLKLISNILLNNSKDVFAFCLTGNTEAYNLYKKLGFDIIDVVEWCRFTGS